MPTNLTYKNPFIKIIENIKSASFESKALFFLLLLVSIHLLLYFNCFMVPSSDFFGFRNRALEYLSLSLPARFGRMPLYPILIGLFSKILPIKYPILIAAEIINLVLAIFSLLLIYRIARMFLKKGALVVVWLFALNPLFTELAIQPLLEPLLLVTILLTLYWELIKSRKSYLGAFLASITRYDAVVLIPILALKDLICRKKKLLTLGLGLLSATGITIWMILSIQHSVLINPYIDGFVSRGGLSPSAPVFFIHRLVYSVYSVVSFLPRSVFENALTGSLLSFVLVSLASGIMGVLGIIGIFSIIKNSFKDFSVILFFLLTCTAGHIIIGACVGRYIFPTLWIFYLVIVRGIECICEFVKKKYHTTLILQQNTLKFAASAGILGFVISNVYILKMPVKEFLMYIGYLLFIGLFLANITGKLSIKQVYLVIFACVFLSFPVKGNLSNTINRIDAAKWSLAEFRKVGEWYGKNDKEGDRMVLTVSGIARYYSRLSPEYFVHLGCFKSNSYEEFIRELSDRKIMYVVWDNHFGYRSGSRYYNQYKAWFYGRYYNQYKAWLVSFLRDGDDKPHFKLIKRIKVQSREALIYKFNPLN